MPKKGERTRWGEGKGQAEPAPFILVIYCPINQGSLFPIHIGHFLTGHHGIYAQGLKRYMAEFASFPVKYLNKVQFITVSQWFYICVENYHKYEVHYTQHLPIFRQTEESKMNNSKLVFVSVCLVIISEGKILDF